jgi:pyridoxal phosphate-dependent aminotransferase EpsN
MHLQPVFAGCEAVGGEVAEALFRDGLCLPSGSSLAEADLERIVGAVRGCCKFLASGRAGRPTGL